MSWWHGTAAHPHQLLVSGVDYIDAVPLDVEPLRWTDQAGEAWGRASWVVEDTTATRTLQGGAEVGIVVNGTRVFTGTLVGRELERLPGAGRLIRCEAVSADSWLDWRIVPRWSSREDISGRIRQLTTDRQMVKDLVERRGGPLRATNATVTETNTDMDLVRAQRKSLREALELVADEAQSVASPGKRSFYVDEQYRVHWYDGLEGTAAPYRIADGSYVRTVLDTAGLVEYWSLREESGTTNHGAMSVADLTLGGSYTQSVTDIGAVNDPDHRATTFSATGRSTNASAPSALFPGDTFSFEFWFRRAGSFGGFAYLILSLGGTDDAYEVNLQSSDKLRLQRRGIGLDFESTQTFTDTDWHHCVIAHEPGDTKVYIDGSSIAGTHTNRVFGSGATQFRVSNSSSGFVGSMQHVAVYNVKLSAATALAHYRQGLSIAPEHFSLQDAWEDVGHHAYVVGQDKDGSGWVYNTGSDFERGAVQFFIERPHSDTRAERKRAGRAAIARRGRVRGYYFATQQAAAWRAGQKLYVTDATLGLSADTFEIKAINGELGPGGVPMFEIEAGALRRRLSRYLRRRR